MEIVIAALVAFVIGVMTHLIVSKINGSSDKPVGVLYTNKDQLLLELSGPIDECVANKKHVTLQVIHLDSHK